MKIQFESDLNYQNNAINSIVNIFEGQEIVTNNFFASSMTRVEYV